jgi:membrane protein implicated in regulation of membrane protease activity
MALVGDPSPPPESASHSAGGNGSRSSEPDSAENPATAAFRQVPLFVAELRAYFRYYLGAKLDGYKARARQAVIYAILAVLGLIVVASVLATSVFLIMWGLAHAVGRLLGGHIWAGQLIVGLLVLGGIALAMWIVTRRFTRAARRRTEQKYEQQRTQQRVHFGHDVHERAKSDGK